MGTLRFPYDWVKLKDGYQHSLETKEFDKFNASLLDLGNIKATAKTINAIAAIFDLESFTKLCSQIDPQLVVPEYLNNFLYWLFENLAREFTFKKQGKRIYLWSPLPFFGKFLGDGVLFLWDTDEIRSKAEVGNIVMSLLNICDMYEQYFVPDAQASHSDVPPRLRVGIARGHVYSIGGGKDYVGPCINIAARLQRLGSPSFALARKGFDPGECFTEAAREYFVIRKTSVRGIGESEMVFILKKEFNRLKPEEKKSFRK